MSPADQARLPLSASSSGSGALVCRGMGHDLPPVASLNTVGQQQAVLPGDCAFIKRSMMLLESDPARVGLTYAVQQYHGLVFAAVLQLTHSSLLSRLALALVHLVLTADVSSVWKHDHPRHEQLQFAFDVLEAMFPDMQLPAGALPPADADIIRSHWLLWKANTGDWGTAAQLPMPMVRSMILCPVLVCACLLFLLAWS
jgi:hypothetical protein